MKDNYTNILVEINKKIYEHVKCLYILESQKPLTKLERIIGFFKFKWWQFTFLFDHHYFMIRYKLGLNPKNFFNRPKRK